MFVSLLKAFEPIYIQNDLMPQTSFHGPTGQPTCDKHLLIMLTLLSKCPGVGMISPSRPRRDSARLSGML
jgi:hypothetical protein